MLVEYSHSKGLCESDLLSQHEEEEEENFDANTTRCVYLQQVASSWVIGVTPHMVGKHMFGDKTDMQTLCAPAVIVAASLTYYLDEECPHTFALKKETPRTDGQVGFNKGLWALGKDDYDPEPDMQAVAVYRSFNSSCTFDQCYAMGSICRDELASDGKDETDQFCRRWCCALLVASGRSDLSAKATRLRAKDDVPMVIIGDGGCKSVSDGVTDEWCTNTCKGGSPDGGVLSSCPTNLCACDDDDTEQVDYDPIQRANEPDTPAEAPAPTQPGQAPAPVAVPAQGAAPAATVPGQAPAPTQIPAAGQAATAPAAQDPSSV